MPADERVETTAVVVTRRLIAGSAIILVAGFATVMVFPGPEPTGRILTMTIVTGVLAAFAADWRACLGIMATSMLVFVDLPVLGFGVEPGGFAVWCYTPLLALATMLGFGYRRMINSSAPEAPQRSNGPPGNIDPEA
jgi:hypothetical protein